ncbi:MAG: ABC-type nitrate/sulfonate/bicarbonate transport system, periplasmic component [Oscillospiraceae bacterium]|jgi:putative hydroxymethylpyrimidine transport system substrate-binding protein|nr:ABC-type nitrate/sulfonate/bicarbonate transport system, periplasmic component [Oscillospiraceae bacterium]
MKKLLSIFMAVLMLLVIVGCGAKPSAAPAESSKAPELKEIDVVLDWYPNALHAFLYTAIEKGYYAEEGLKVNIRFPSNANDAMSLVAAGKAQVGLYYQQDVIMARVNQKVPVRSIGAVVQSPLNIVLNLKSANIHSPKDLVGKTIGYAGTELSEALIRSMMANVGADYNDVQMIDVGFDLMSSMTTGNVDATIGCYINHEVPQMIKEGFEVDYFMVDGYGVPTYYEGVFMSNDEMIKNDPDTLKAFLKASAKGFADMKINPEESLAILLKNQNTENFPLSESVERESMTMLLPLMETETAPFLSQTEEIWQKNIDWLYDQGLITEKPVVSDLMATL